MATIKRLDGKDTTQLTLQEYTAELASAEQAVRDDRLGELVVDIADPLNPVLYVVTANGTAERVSPTATGVAAGDGQDVQFNIDGILAAAPEFKFDPVTLTLTTSNLAVMDSVATDLTPLDTNVFNLGSQVSQWNTLYAANIVVGNAQIDNFVVPNLAVNKLMNGTSDVTVYEDSNIAMTVNGVANIMVVSDVDGVTVTGDLNVPAGNLNLAVGNLKLAGGANNQFLRTDGNGNLEWVSGQGGAAGANRDIQFNIDGYLEGSNLFTYDPVTDTVSTANIVVLDSVASHLDPIDDRVFDLGSPSYYWGHVYTGNITADNATLGNVTIGNVVVTKITNGTTEVATELDGNITMTANGVANIVVVTETGTQFTGLVAVGNIANLQILGGNSGQALSTDGTGNLFWADGGGNKFGNGTSNGVVSTADGPIQFAVNGVSNVLVLTDTGANVRGNLEVLSNLTSNNATVAANLVSGNANIVNRITAGNANITTNLVVANANVTTRLIANLANIETLNTPNANIGNLEVVEANIAGNLAIVGNLQAATANILGNLVADNIVARLDFTAATANIETLVANNITLTANITALNITATDNLFSNNATVASNLMVGNLDVAGLTVTANLDVASNILAPNITSLENFAAANATFTGNVDLGANGNVRLSGGANGQYLQTDGSGNLKWATVSGTRFANGTSNGSIDTADGNITFGVTGVANVVVFTPTGIEVADTIKANTANILANVNTGNLLAADAIIGNNIQANANVAAGNLNLTDDIAANNAVFTGNLSAANLAITDDIAANNIVLSANVTAFTGLFSGNLAVTDDITANNVTVAANIATGNLAATGNLSANNAAITANITTGNITVASRLTTVTANISGNLTANNANIAESLKANSAAITGNLTSGNADLGNLATANFFSGDGGLLSNIQPAGLLRGSFAFNSASPLSMGNLAIGAVVTQVTLTVVTPFDDPASSLTVGDASNATLLVPAAYSSTSASGSYGTLTATRFGAATEILLTIDPGTSSVGDGVYSITYQ